MQKLKLFSNINTYFFLNIYNYKDIFEKFSEEVGNPSSCGSAYLNNCIILTRIIILKTITRIIIIKKC
jgi:hypothetical protein